MAPGHDEVVTAIVLEALPFTTTTMSAYELHPKVRRALCMHHTMSPPFASSISRRRSWYTGMYYRGKGVKGEQL